ncbi:MAG TPA: hypothetical protein VN317_04005 [Candidatus Methanoperedens sp.]|nr:hypothetical protein [Candidatus Methanoperedens sp.]
MKTSVLVATAALAVLAATPALTADFRITPASITMTVTTGESSSTTVVGSVNNPPPIPYTVAVQLRPIGGSLPASWLTTQPASLTNRAASLLLTLTVNVPPTAAPGTYSALIHPVVLASSIPLAPPPRPLQLILAVASRCAAAPTVSIASVQPAEFKAPNNKLEDVTIAGSALVPPGCTLQRLWYTLSDEYGVFGETKEIAVGPDGSFSFATPVQVSRRGDDKDGRTYQITVYAGDEAGTGASAPAELVVRHDQRGEK